MQGRGATGCHVRDRNGGAAAGWGRRSRRSVTASPTGRTGRENDEHDDARETADVSVHSTLGWASLAPARTAAITPQATAATEQTIDT